MKRKLVTLAAAALSLLCLIFCARAQGEWMYPLEREILEDPMDVLRLVNKDNPLPKSYPDQSEDMYRLVKVSAPVTGGTHMLRKVASDALSEMMEAAERAGIDLYVDSAYRKYRTQEVMHYNRVKRLGYDDGYVQAAGASEHQTGLAADVICREYRDRYLVDFEHTVEGRWLAQNCTRFGFIIRYPKDKEDVTGIRYEPWHIRYVGREAAQYMAVNNLTLEEFTEEYKRYLAKYGL